MSQGISIALACGALLAFLVPTAWASGEPEVYPEVSKLAFDHQGRDSNVDHDGNPVQNPSPVRWYWHPGQNYQNVAGVQFQLKYDPYEVDILGINPGLGWAFHHWRFQAPGPTPPSEGNPEPPGGLPGMVVGTVWFPQADQSGMQLAQSQAVPIFDLQYAPKHTSHYSHPQFNSEVDVQVSQLIPIYHITQGQKVNSVWEVKHNDGEMVNIPVSATYGIHRNSVSGVWIHNSGIIWPGPLASNAQSPRHVSINITLKSSDYIYAGQGQGSHYVDVHMADSQYKPVHLSSAYPDHPGYHLKPGETVRITGMVVGPSWFYAGAPVLGQHLGLGIDHVPEPVTIALLGLGSFAAVMSRRHRRRA